MFQTFLKTAVAIVCIAPAFSAEGWVTNLDEAKKQAAEKNKLILAEFTGSDWCTPCKMLKKDVMDTPEFGQEASKDFILLELDFPRKNDHMSEEQKKANNTAKDEYGIRGFPTVLYLLPNGEPVGGFIGGRSKEAVLKSMDEAKTNKELFINAQKVLASDATSEAKAKELVIMYNALNSEIFQKKREALKEEILKLDPEDKTQFSQTIKKEQEQADNRQKMGEELRQYFQENSKKRMEYKTYGEMAKNVHENIKAANLMPMSKQVLVMQNSRVYVTAGMLDEAEKFIEEGIAFDPNSEMAEVLRSNLDALKKDRAENENKLKAGEIGPDKKVEMIPATKMITPTAPKK